MNKKNLDKLFQEQFSGFSDVPTEKVWKSIEAYLNTKKKSRKVIPFWWKLGGIAAVLALGLFLINPFKDTGSDTIITNVEEVKENHSKQKNDVNPSVFPNSPKVAGQTISEEDEKDGNTGIDAQVKSIKTPNTLTSPSKNQGVTANDEGQETLQSKQSESIQIAVYDVKNGKERLNTVEKNGIAKPQESTMVSSEQVAGNDDSAITQTIDDKNADNKLDSPGIKADEEVAVALKGKDPEEKIEEGKKSIFEELEAQEEEIAEAKKGKWSAGPSIAPVYFSAIGNGSPVHSIFVPNSKSGDVNLSYGLAVSYEISDKLSLKTGIHKVDYGYNTNEVEFSSTLESFGTGQIKNINYSPASRNIRVESKADNISSLTERTALDVAAQDPSLSGVMAQQIGYLEIPLELNYALVDSKFGIDLIGGFSSLFLMDNAVSLTSGDLTTEMGEANNLNTVNFSTNVGFGVNYKFTTKLHLNIEPIFKYQLNTFSDTAGEFKPFTIGVYSGLNFKF